MTKEIKLTEDIKRQMLNLQPMSRTGTTPYTPLHYQVSKIPIQLKPVFELRQLTNEELDLVEIAKNQCAIDLANMKDSTGEEIHAANKRKKKTFIKAIGGAVTSWSSYYDPEKFTEKKSAKGEITFDYSKAKIEYDLGHLVDMRDDILLDIMGEACALSGYTL